MIFIYTEIINGKEYRLVTLRGRSKLVSQDACFINPKRRNQKVTFHENTDGYLCCGGGVPVHLYVAHGWVKGYKKGLEVNHKDFNRKNNNASNLEWVSHLDNVRYSAKYNKQVWNQSKQGERNGRAMFTTQQVLKIRQLYDNGMSVVDILKIDHPELNTQKKYHSLHSTYTNICKRRTWKNI